METYDSVLNSLCREFSKLSGSSNDNQLVECLVSQQSDAEAKNLLFSNLNPKVAKHRQFVEEFLRFRRSLPREQSYQVYSKPDVEEEYYMGKSKGAKGKKPKRNENGNVTEDASSTISADHVESSELASNISDLKKRTKFVPLFSAEGHSRSVAKLPGRHLCDCVATKHSLINNCLSCGRIVCEQEGSGPCLFCGKLVCTKDEQAILNRGSKKSDALRKELMQRGGKTELEDDEKVTASLQKAIDFKNRLLEYDRTSAKRTQVIDDQSDYFTVDSSSWLSPTDRAALSKREAELSEKRHGSRRGRSVTIDLAGRRVLECTDFANMYDPNDEIVRRIYGKEGLSEAYTTSSSQTTSNDGNRIVDESLDLSLDYLPKFISEDERNGQIENTTTSKTHLTVAEEPHKPRIVRLQDKHLQEMSDDGLCLSMHQPWASLLVRGIKKHEGRTWYHQHRGRLWIAATSRVPDKFDIEEVENECKQRLGDGVQFPKDYPSGCLLGCVNVVDCLSQEEYREKFPDGESFSSYVFICTDPCELLIKFPIKGEHKMYKLDHRLHQSVRKTILHSYADS